MTIHRLVTITATVAVAGALSIACAAPEAAEDRGSTDSEWLFDEPRTHEFFAKDKRQPVECGYDSTCSQCGESESCTRVHAVMIEGRLCQMYACLLRQTPESAHSPNAADLRGSEAGGGEELGGEDDDAE